MSLNASNGTGLAGARWESSTAGGARGCATLEAENTGACRRDGMERASERDARGGAARLGVYVREQRGVLNGSEAEVWCGSGKQASSRVDGQLRDCLQIERARPLLVKGTASRSHENGETQSVHRPPASANQELTIVRVRGAMQTTRNERSLAPCTRARRVGWGLTAGSRSTD